MNFYDEIERRHDAEKVKDRIKDDMYRNLVTNLINQIDDKYFPVLKKPKESVMVRRIREEKIQKEKFNKTLSILEKELEKRCEDDIDFLVENLKDLNYFSKINETYNRETMVDLIRVLQFVTYKKNDVVPLSFKATNYRWDQNVERKVYVLLKGLAERRTELESKKEIIKEGMVVGDKDIYDEKIRKE